MIDKIKGKCNGCGLCAEICPVNAISMKKDLEGFFRPSINVDVCIECDLCENYCPTLKNDIKDLYNNVYAVKNTNSIRMKSSSGGIFTALSDYILKLNGVVYGAVFDEQWQVIHSRADRIEERDKMRGSKYVQGTMYNCYKQVLEDLFNKRWVMFTGTPCQCAAIKKYVELKKAPIERFVLCDILCEGVPSPRVWKDYLDFLTENHSDEIINVNFRSKIKGWKRIYIYIETNRKKYIIPDDKDIFYQLFNLNYCMRSSCNCCDFVKTDRNTDLTYGDFWAIDELPDGFDDDKGVTMLLVNSEKGMQIWSEIQSKLEWAQSNMTAAMKKQNPLKCYTLANSDRGKFWEIYNEKGFEKAIKKFTTYGIWVRIRRKIMKHIRKILPNKKGI